MNSPTNKLKRRDFLTGAASTIGAGLLAVPGLAAAQGLVGAGGGTLGTAPPSLYFWNGTTFVPASQAIPNINASQVVVQMSGYGTSTHIGSIDVEMPGGTYHAFTSAPQGQRVVRFVAPISPSVGLTLNIIGASSKSRILMQTSQGSGPVLAAGTYLLVDPGVSATGFLLTGSPTAPVTFEGGQPVSVPFVLITISE